MKNKVLKKTLAAALALTLVGGGVPTAIAGTNIFEPGIVANAEVKLIAAGNEYYTGDTIDFGNDDVYVTDYRSNYIGKTFTLDDDFDLDSNGEHYSIKNANDPSDTIVISANGLSDTPIGLKVYGQGTYANPYTFKAILPEKTVQLSNVSVDLDDSITLKFYAPIEKFDDAGVNKVTLSGPNDTIDITAFVKDKTNSYYVFSYPLYATQLDEDVTIQFKKGSNVIKIKSEHEIYNEYSYKVNDYCDYVITDTDDRFDAKTEKAAKSLKNLGLAADNYFENKSNEITFLDSSYNLSAYAPQTEDDVKFSLVLDSKFAARVYIPGLEDDASFEGFNAITGKDGKNCFEVSGLKPTDLGKTYYVEAGEYDARFTALSYCYRAINSTNTNTSNIAKAVYEYYKYIKKYTMNSTVTIKNTGSKGGSLDFNYQEDMTWEELASERYSFAQYVEIKKGKYVGLFSINTGDGYLRYTYGEVDDYVRPNDVINKNYYYYSEMEP